MSVTVKIEGLDDVVKRMLEAPSKVERYVAAAAVRAAAKPVINRARSLLPTKRDGSTGQLRKSIGVRVKRYKGAVWAGVGPRPGFKAVKRTTRDGKPVYHNPTQIAHLVERGTSRARARPFLRPAIDGTRNEQFSSFARKAEESFERLKL